MPVAIQSSVGFDHNVASTSYTTGDIVIPASGVALLSHTISNDSGVVNTISSTNGITWNKINEITNPSQSNKPTVSNWYAVNTTAAAITTQATINNSVSTRCVTNVAIITGADTANTIGTTFTVSGGSVSTQPYSTGNANGTNSMWFGLYGSNNIPLFTTDASDTFVIRTATSAGGGGATKGSNVMVYDTDLAKPAGATFDTRGAWSFNAATAFSGVEVKEAAAGGGSTTPAKVNGIKTWNGTAWVVKPVKVWNGTGWVQKPLKRWSGTAWVAVEY